jgi:hypothetical protein
MKKVVLHSSNKRGEILTHKFTPINNSREALLVKASNTLILRVGRSVGWVFNANNLFGVR